MEEEKKEQPEEQETQEEAPVEANEEVQEQEAPAEEETTEEASEEENKPEEPGVEEEVVDKEPTPEPKEFDIENEKEPEGEDITKDELTDVDKEIEKEEEEIKKEDEELEEVDKEIAEDVKETEDIPVEEKEEPKVEEKKEEEAPEPAKEEKKEDEEVSDVDETQALIDELKEKEEEPKVEEKKEEEAPKPEEKEEGLTTHIYALRTTANREDQVMDFVTSNAEKKKFNVYSVIRAHGMRGYIFVEADSKGDAEQAAFGVPYARGILPKEIDYHEIEHMLEQVKREVNIQQNDIVEIISGPFKRENAKIIRIDKGKEEVVVELLEAAVPIPITLKLDAVKVIRRETEEEESSE